MTSVPGVQPQRLTGESAEIFQKAVRYALTEWPSLTLAIENGMGGSNATEKQKWMCEHVAEVMISNKDLDLDDYLYELINQEFDTIIEDGSLEYNAHWINKFYKDCLDGKQNEVLNSITQAASKRQSLSNMRIPPPINATSDTDDDTDDGEDNDDE